MVFVLALQLLQFGDFGLPLLGCSRFGFPAVLSGRGLTLFSEVISCDTMRCRSDIYWRLVC